MFVRSLPLRFCAIESYKRTVCWECIVGWSREKQECPLCRQAVQLQGLLPVYNL